MSVWFVFGESDFGGFAEDEGEAIFVFPVDAEGGDEALAELSDFVDLIIESDLHRGFDNFFEEFLIFEHLGKREDGIKTSEANAPVERAFEEFLCLVEALVEGVGGLEVFGGDFECANAF